MLLLLFAVILSPTFTKTGGKKRDVQDSNDLYLHLKLFFSFWKRLNSLQLIFVKNIFFLHLKNSSSL